MTFFGKTLRSGQNLPIYDLKSRTNKRQNIYWKKNVPFNIFKSIYETENSSVLGGGRESETNGGRAVSPFGVTNVLEVDR